MINSRHIPLYWKCQLVGWSIAALYWAFGGWFYGNFRWDIAVVQFVLDLIMYISITHAYRNFSLANYWHNLALNSLINRMLIAIPIMGLLYTLVTLIKLYLVRLLFSINLNQSFTEFFNLNALGIFIGGIRLMAIWLLAYHLYHYAKREIRLSMENAKLELSFKQAQLDNLSMQLNPHFLFNSLNTIKSFIYANPVLAGRGVDLLSELLRNGLYKGKNMLISLEEELGLVKDYLELEKLRMEERLSYKLSVDTSLSDKLIPRMCIQTLVENAVKHGVSIQKEGGEIEIVVKPQGDFLYILVRSVGKLAINPNHLGIGLQNLKERLQINYHGRANFKLYESEQHVFAEITIPIK
ncbi:MAG TPA: histidine kinase [Pedobacter sp.]|nr:histidine kinase [Pedobacter sp.]